VKLALAVCLALILPSVAYSQAGGDPEHVIRRMFDTGSFEGHDQKVIGGLGDAGAVLVSKILAGRGLTSEVIDTALVVIDSAFADPTFVEAVEDRQPRTALLLLRYFDLSTNDVALKKRIADAVKYVQDRYTASLHAAK
jgi:hypothetical protein